ncbi:unnamed protein product [Jaminaea pallidilutea]
MHFVKLVSLVALMASASALALEGPLPSMDKHLIGYCYKQQGCGGAGTAIYAQGALAAKPNSCFSFKPSVPRFVGDGVGCKDSRQVAAGTCYSSGYAQKCITAV